jgi:uncharacterized membrane protein YqjE
MESSAEPSFVQLVQDILSNVRHILRSEVRLAKVELTEEVSKGGKASAVLLGGVVFALYALGFLLLAAVYALSLSMPLWGAALVTAGFAAVVATVSIVIGRQRIGRVHLKPERTVETMKENMGWLRHHTK